MLFHLDTSEALSHKNVCPSACRPMKFHPNVSQTMEQLMRSVRWAMSIDINFRNA